MSVNLVDLVLKQVGGNVPGILGSLLGESADRTQGALAGAIPAILGGLMGAASKGGGIADQIAAAVDQQDDGILDNLAGAFGSGNHRQIAEQGSSVLSSLLGDGVIGTLVGAIGKFSGLGGGSTKSLLGMLVPIVMSVLSREKTSQGLDTGGMMNLLASQKDNIESAMPAGLSSALGGAGFLDNLMGTAQSATSSITEAAESAVGKVGQAAGQAATAVGGAAASVGDSARDAAASTSAAVGAAASQGRETASRTAEQVGSGVSQTSSDARAAAAGAAQSGGSWLRWLLPLVILLALLWFAFKFLGGSGVEETAENAGDAVSAAVEATTEAAGEATDAAGEAASSAAEATTEAASDAADTAADAAGDAADAASDAASSAAETVTAMVGDVDVGGELTSAFDSLKETLSGITDVDSAKEALPQLQEVSDGLDNLTGLADQLGDDAAGALSGLVSSSLAGIDSALASLTELPGVGDVIEPVIEEIREKLAAFTAA